MSWPLVEIGELVQKISTWNPMKSESIEQFNYVDLSSVDKDRKIIDLGSVPKVFTNEAPSRARQLLQSNDVLVSTVRPNLNGVAKVPSNLNGATASTGYCVLRGESEKLDSKYLYFWVQTNLFVLDMISKSTGANYPAVSDKIIKQSKIPLPPLDEQKRIAAILDKADAIRRKRQQAINLADDFLRSVFLDMFGDPISNPMDFEEETIGNLCEDLFLGLTSKVDYVDDGSGFPLVRAKDINTGELKFDVIKYISETQHKKLTKNHLTRKGDLLVSKSGTLGTCAIVKTDKQFSTYESIFTVRPNLKKLNTLFFINLIQNKSFQQKLIGKKVGGTVAHLNLKMFRDLPFALPPIELQNKFADKIAIIDKKVLKYRDSLAFKSDLFNSLSQQAFAGEL